MALVHAAQSQLELELELAVTVTGIFTLTVTVAVTVTVTATVTVTVTITASPVHGEEALREGASSNSYNYSRSLTCPCRVGAAQGC